VLSVAGLSKSFGPRTLFRDVTFRLTNGRRIALVGGNGVGKTTLLEIIVGTQEADTGDVSRQKDLRIGYLPQELLDVWESSVLDEVLKGANHVLELETEMRSLEAQMATTTGEAHDKVMEAYGITQSQFEQLGGYQLEPEARRILGGLGFTTADMDRPLAEMSGGWQMRASLARLLLQQPDILVLDEPTNHLDLQSKQVLLDSLKGYQGTIVFVSHDRYFVDELATRVIEVGAGKVESYPGNYEDFLVAKQRLGDSTHSTQRVEQQAQAADEQPLDKDARRQAHAERKEQQRREQKRERELSELEKRIEILEGELAKLEQQMAEPELYQDAERWRRVSNEHGAQKSQLDDAYQLWEGLQERA